MGTVGQVEPIQANIRDEASTARAIIGSDAVINCVGILVESGKQSFESLQTDGAARIARLAAEHGVRRLVQISAIGANADSDSDYARSKAAGEAAVTSAFPGAVILRPSIIFGTEDEFFNRFGAMARLSPVIPLVGADTRFQPVYVDDVAAAAVKAATSDVAPGVYELGGPETATFRELIERLLRTIERKRAIIVLPPWFARLQAGALDTLSKLTFGLWTNGLLTRDQVRQLGRDNVVAPDARGFADLGIEPTAMDAILEGYLYSYRPHGQFDAITASADNLRQR
jgi:NADH dehydrogenase